MVFNDHYRAVLGVNLGRNKDSASAAKDYCDGVSFTDGDDGLDWLYVHLLPSIDDFIETTR